MASFLDGLEILSSLSQESKDNLSNFCQERVLKKWEVLFSEWEEWSAMYFLKIWKIDIIKNIDWNNTKVWEVKAEWILWEMALFQDKNNRRWATCVASEDCLLIVILWFSINELKNKHPDIIAKIKNIIEIRNFENSKL